MRLPSDLMKNNSLQKIDYWSIHPHCEIPMSEIDTVILVPLTVDITIFASNKCHKKYVEHMQHLVSGLKPKR